jgi:hypothetical protein
MVGSPVGCLPSRGNAGFRPKQQSQIAMILMKSLKQPSPGIFYDGWRYFQLGIPCRWLRTLVNRLDPPLSGAVARA